VDRIIQADILSRERRRFNRPNRVVSIAFNMETKTNTNRVHVMGAKRAICIYLISIVAANLAVNYFGPGASIIIAFLFIGLDLSLRDYLHDVFGDRLIVKMGTLIISGSVITVLLNLDAMQIAFASTVAFSLSSIADSFVYQFLKSRKFLIKSNVSNIAGSAVDSIVFPTIAFGALMPEIIMAQFVSKLIGGFIFALIIQRMRSV